MKVKVKQKEPSVPYEERLKRAGAVDLKNNQKTVDLGNGYVKILPIDKKKRWE